MEEMGLWSKATIHQNTPEDPLQITEKMGLWNFKTDVTFRELGP